MQRAPDNPPGPRPRTPVHLWLGLALVALFWPLNWGLEGMRTHLLFAPQWLGYVLVVDGLLVRRRGESILTRSPRGFAALFALSVPVWWLFETINRRLGNWEYLGGEELGDVAYVVLSSISFSTVIPAVFCTAELVRSSDWVERFAHGPRIAPSRGLCLGLFVAGWTMIALMLLWPRWFFPLEWMSLVFVLEPVCVWLGRRSFLTDLARGDWRNWVALWVGALICGFFWEMWNVHSFPKWIYHVPGVDFARIFEMPLLGYLGYLPFSMELWLVARLVWRDPPTVRL